MRFNRQQSKLIVAHPDDEVLFFSSLLNYVEEVIICFEESSSIIVTEGRKSLVNKYPYKKTNLLRLSEANVYDGFSFTRREILREGISVLKNRDKYSENFDKLKSQFRNTLKKGDLIFTHNPWGEYGHPEHIQVFAAVQSLALELELEVYVSGYVSDKTLGLMSRRCNLLGTDFYSGHPNSMLGESIKNLYIENKCWTWNKDYCWPSQEIFYRLQISGVIATTDIKDSSYPPLNILTEKFTHSFFKGLASRYLSGNIKWHLKKIFKLK